MPFSRLTYSPEDLALLQGAYNSALADLGIGAGDALARKLVAEIIIADAKEMDTLDAEGLRQRAVAGHRAANGRS